MHNPPPTEGENEPRTPSEPRTSWLERALATGTRAARAAHEEVLLATPARLVAHVASELLPAQTFARTRTALYRAAGVRIGSRSLILSALRLTGIRNTFDLLSIGDDTIITGPLHVDLAAPVRIGDNVRIGHDVTLLTIDHEIGTSALRSGTSFFRGVTIGDGSWIASRATVLPGVSIGRGAVIAAGAVVTRDVAANTLVAGIPARVVRTLEADPTPNDTAE